MNRLACEPSPFSMQIEKLLSYCDVMSNVVLANKLMPLPFTIRRWKEDTFGAKVAWESSCGCAFNLADPSNIEESSWIKSLDPTYNEQTSDHSAPKTTEAGYMYDETIELSILYRRFRYLNSIQWDMPHELW